MAASFPSYVIGYRNWYALTCLPTDVVVLTMIEWYDTESDWLTYSRVGVQDL